MPEHTGPRPELSEWTNSFLIHIFSGRYIQEIMELLQQADGTDVPEAVLNYINPSYRAPGYLNSLGYIIERSIPDSFPPEVAAFRPIYSMLALVDTYRTRIPDEGREFFLDKYIPAVETLFRFIESFYSREEIVSAMETMLQKLKGLSQSDTTTTDRRVKQRERAIKQLEEGLLRFR